MAVPILSSPENQTSLSSTRTMCGARSPHFSDILAVHRSGGSSTWVSTSWTLSWSRTASVITGTSLDSSQNGSMCFGLRTGELRHDRRQVEDRPNAGFGVDDVRHGVHRRMSGVSGEV